MRVVLDVNVLISAVLSPEGPPARIVAAWLRGDIEVIVSPALLDELDRALRYPKIRSRLPASEAREVLEQLALWATLEADPPADDAPGGDPADAYLFALARGSGAILVTGDSALLEAGDDLPIESPRAFLDRLEPP